jgi:UDP-GlcNAc:undecaprenyl-phosphate GlcNAc-1-phosphate transferase
MLILFLSALTAFALSYLAIPNIIHIARDFNLSEEPGYRSSHHVRTPALGGIAIFSGTVFSIIMWTPFGQLGTLQYLLCAFIIVFLVGVRDDIMPIRAINKLIGQLIAAVILVFKSDVSLKSFYGLLGFYHDFHPYIMSILSVLLIVLLINAFNFIDGINGLAGSIGVLTAGVLGAWFYWVGYIELAIVASTLVGAVIAFLKYNCSPAKIFMGDSGAMLIGLAVAVLIIQFIDRNAQLDNTRYHFQAAPVIAICIAIIPLFDTLRVLATRWWRGRHLFSADRRHIHHLLIDYGFTHMQATGILMGVNIGFILLAFSLGDWLDMHLILGIVFIFATVLTYFLHKKVSKKKRAKPVF